MNFASPEAALLAAASDMLSRHDPDGTFRYASPATRNVIGYEPDEIVGRPGAEFVHPDDRERVGRALAELLQADGPGHLLTYRALHREGHVVWIEAHGRVLRDAGTGQPRELIVVARDISVRVRTEQRLEEERALLETVFENSPSGISLLRAIRDERTGQVIDFGYVRRNRASRRLVGAPDDEDLTGRTAVGEHPQIRENGILDRFVRVLETGVAWEGEQYTRQGREDRWYYSTVARLDAEQISVSYLNITDGKLAERQAREAREQLSLAAEVAEVGWSVRDLRTGSFEVSAIFRQIYGLPADGPVDFERLRRLMHPQDLADLVAGYDLGIASGQDQRTRARFRRADTGEERTVLGVSRVVKNDAGQPIQVLSSVIDITDVARAEQEMTDAREQLSMAAEIAGVGLSMREISSDQLTISPTLASIYGFEPTRRTVTLAELYALSNAEDVAAYRDEYAAALAGGGTCHMRYRIHRANDGEERTLLSRLRVLLGEDGRAVRTWVATIDITDALRLEQRAAEAHSTLNLVAEVTGVGISERELDSDVMWLSPEYARILGLPPGTSQLPVAELFGIFESEATGQRFRAYKQAVLHGVHHGPIRLGGRRVNDQQPFTMLVAAGVQPATDTRPARVQSVVVDITETVAAEQRAAAVQEQLALAVEASGLGLSSRDVETGEVEMSPAFARLYGFDPGRTHAHISELLALSNPEDVRGVRPTYENATALPGAIQQVRYRIRRFDTGEERTLLTTSRTVGDPARPGARVLAATLDVTDLLRERAEAEQLRYWQRLTNQLPEILWVTDPTGRTLHINQRWFELTGQTEEDVINNTWQRAIHPSDAQAAGESFRVAIAGGNSWEHELRLRGRDGSWRWYLSRAVPLRPPGQPNAAPEGWIGLSLDIHDRVQALAALKRANADLDTFVYAAAHDLKSPIDNLEAILEALMDELMARVREQPSAHDEVALELFGHATNAVSRFRATLADLAQVVASLPVDAGRPGPLDLATYVADLVLDMEGEFAAAHGLLCLDLRVPTLGSLPARHLRTLLYNLINNSLKYRHPDRPVRLWLRTRAAGPAWIELALTDNGIGLDTQRATRAFELFGRLHPGAAGGTGIGLFIVRRVVEQVGGQIRVSGRAGEGTTFFIRLPRF